jgi:DNA repair protein RecO (recombination protein O)
MAAARCLALVVRGTDVFDTSRVFTLFTRELGRTEAIAKGARRLKSPFENGLDLLSVCDIVLLRKSGDTLDLLTEAMLVERFDALRRNLPTHFAGCYVAELLTDLTHSHDPHPKLFDAAVITLRHLSDPNLLRRRVMRFELALLRELGLMPSLDHCVHCGSVSAIAEASDRVAFGLSMGGVLCRNCRDGQPHVATLTRSTLDLIGHLGRPGRLWRDVGEARDEAAAREVLSAVVCHLMGRRPRMHKYLHTGIFR